MGADVSRIRNNPLLDYAGVELKQGGVVLDADFNELVAIADRRIRAATSDILGRSTVSSNTPDAFKITANADGLQIGKGRIYVDGLLAENHGAVSADPAKRLFDPLMAEAQFADPVDYAAQPYLPSPPELPQAGRHLVYLDVWDREVTHLEQPELVEPAVGVETSSRRQTVWQVRVLDPEARDATCATPDGNVDGWSDLIAPSAGRLTTGTFEVPEEEDPCELPPTGGFRGLENQTYRVEIHDPGQPGDTATFKWSRDNGSVAFAVTSVVSDSQLELQTLGRDDVLRLKTGDWVEVTDDPREFSQRCGEVRQITVTEAERRISFSPALPPEMLPTVFPDGEFPRERHLRVRRWDQRGKVLQAHADGTTTVFQDLGAGTAGVINVPTAGTTLLVEDGITVSFDSVGTKGFRAGDFWVFAARTADASVERLDSAPARGIHHHYARLGIWDIAAGSVSDCRTPWPPRGGDGADCACAECVSPESHASGALTIQAAVDRVRDTGGTVCLTVGEYFLMEPVRLGGSRHVRIKGQGNGTKIVTDGGAFHISIATAPSIEDLQIVSLGERPVITAHTVSFLRLERLAILVSAADQVPAVAIELAGNHLFPIIRNNYIVAPIGINAPGFPDPDGDAPTHFLSALLTIEGNQLGCELSGIVLTGQSLHLGATRIARNDIGGCTAGGIQALGVCLSEASFWILENHIGVRSTGIVAAVDGLRIVGNTVACRDNPVGDGVLGISLRSGLDPTGPDQCQVVSNHISDFPGAGIQCRAAVRDLIVEENIIERCGGGIDCFGEDSPGTISIRGNHVRDIVVATEEIPHHVSGIVAGGAQAIEVSNNVVRRIAQAALPSVGFLTGIAASAAATIKVNANHVSDVGPLGEFPGLAVGVFVQSPLADAEITLNHVARELLPVSQGSRSLWAAVAVATSNQFGPGAEPFPLLRVDNTRIVVFGPKRPFLVDHGADAPLRVRNATVHGNVAKARGSVEAVAISVAERCLFSDNNCELRHDSAARAVSIRADAVVASANQVRGGVPSLELMVEDAQHVTVLGNITSGNIVVGSGPLSTPWDVLNIQA